MFCVACGAQLKDGDRFCSMCGKSTSPAAENSEAAGSASYSRPGGPKRLVRTMADKKIAGVCGGVAAYFGVDSTLVRFIWLAMLLLYGVGGLAYIVAWVIMPSDENVVHASV